MKLTSPGVQAGEVDLMPVVVEEFHPDAWAQLTRRFPCVSAQRSPAEVRPGESAEVMLLDDLG
ncbi:hypothetical protein [Deinococcus soli (ex Cha et al. 2016)]|uniref:hypothetical protein n=1 Tax=Deinococcus soli (ex Cha et al. 2016) TaxID=1309411 RepID=UPI001667D8B9|nr:hypothetical protein [Deinococcus soli (ex Cha et al. 2016)]GGB82645.1 hypothetical protein GCM10008019_43510 [Deinococcus soli (ex Cha et al. 2016)]